jgi:hypothetical protein
MRLIGERHLNTLARNRDRKAQLCALAAGIDYFPQNLGMVFGPQSVRTRPVAFLFAF